MDDRYLLKYIIAVHMFLTKELCYFASASIWQESRDLNAARSFRVVANEWISFYHPSTQVLITHQEHFRYVHFGCIQAHTRMRIFLNSQVHVCIHVLPSLSPSQYPPCFQPQTWSVNFQAQSTLCHVQTASPSFARTHA